jgi:hypothetical protein
VPHDTLPAPVAITLVAFCLGAVVAGVFTLLAFVIGVRIGRGQKPVDVQATMQALRPFAAKPKDNGQAKQPERTLPAART